MSDAATLLTGGAPPAPAPGPAAPAPAPTAGAPAAPSPAPAPGEGGAPAPAPGPAPAPSPTWLDSLDDDAKKFVETKGFKTPAEALAALRSGAPPESPDAYELPVPQGEDPAFAKAVAPLMHKAGLSPTQAKALAEGWNEMQAQQRTAAQAAEAQALRDAEAKATREDADLKREWGEAYQANAEHGKRAIAALVPGDQATKLKAAQALEAVIGYAGMMKMWAAIGSHMAEDTAHGMGGTGTNNVTATASRLYDKSNMNP